MRRGERKETKKKTINWENGRRDNEWEREWRR